MWHALYRVPLSDTKLHATKNESWHSSNPLFHRYTTSAPLRALCHRCHHQLLLINIGLCRLFSHYTILTSQQPAMAPFDPIHAAAQLKLTRRIQRHKVWAGQNSSSLQALSGLPPLESENGKATADPPKRQTSPSWDLFPLSIAIPEKPVPVSIPTLASIPSPFADFGNRTEQLLHIVDKRASSGVRKLFKKIRKVSRAESGRVDLRQTMLIGSLPRTAPLTSSRENGSIVYLAQKPSYTAEHSQRKKSTARGEVRQNWVEENHLIKL